MLEHLIEAGYISPEDVYPPQNSRVGTFAPKPPYRWGDLSWTEQIHDHVADEEGV